MPTHSWGPLSSRYQTKAPRRLLALDGGGIRGLISLEILREIETVLAETTKRGSEFRLCQFFDYVAGTSTGAIIAAGLARGMSVSELIDFYQQNGKEMFDRQTLFSMWQNPYKYQSGPLAAKLKEVFGRETNLLPEHLETLLLVVTRNISTDSPWPLSSNPLAKYNDLDLDDCNLRIPLWQLVRASTAAPIYFPPETIQLGKNTFTFVDGGMTPYNNPAFLLYRMATAAEYRLGWQSGEDNLLLVSVGTGNAPVEFSEGWFSALKTNAREATVPRMMYAISVDQDFACRCVGRCIYGPHLDAEIRDMIPGTETTAPRLFRYMRYNADLSDKAIAAIDNGLDGSKLRAMDDVSQMNNLLRVGRAAAAQVKLEHFGSFAHGRVWELIRKPPAGLIRYRRKENTPVVAIRLDLKTQGLKYEKWGSVQEASPGDWLINNQGDVYTVEAQTFEKTYRNIGSGMYEKTSDIWARRADTGGTVKTKEGSTAYAPGDYIVFNDPNGGDGYAVSASKFLSLYEPT